MLYLLDTHVGLWAIGEDENLSVKVKTILTNKAAELFISAISLWEIAIKYRLGKFPEFHSSLPEFIGALKTAGIQILPLKNEHLIHYFNCTFFHQNHKDPFDRLLAAIADYERLAFITKDDKFSVYTTHLSIVW